MFKKIICASLSLVALASTNVSIHAASWHDYAKPAIVGSLAGVTGGLIYTVASGIGAGSIPKGFICSSVPLAVVTLLKAGVNQTEDAGLQESQKKNVLITNTVVGTVTATMAALVKCCLLIGATGGIFLAMAYAGPHASPISDIAGMSGSEGAQFLVGSALASTVAYHCW